jgi:hypothetical protein
MPDTSAGRTALTTQAVNCSLRFSKQGPNLANCISKLEAEIEHLVVMEEAPQFSCGD